MYSGFIENPWLEYLTGILIPPPPTPVQQTLTEKMQGGGIVHPY